MIPADTPRPRRGPERRRHLEPSRRWRNTARWQRTRAQVLAEEKVCRICGSPDDPHVDHIVPVNAGGPKWLRSNLQRLCGGCNAAKGGWSS